MRFEHRKKNPFRHTSQKRRHQLPLHNPFHVETHFFGSEKQTEFSKSHFCVLIIHCLEKNWLISLPDHKVCIYSTSNAVYNIKHDRDRSSVQETCTSESMCRLKTNISQFQILNQPSKVSSRNYWMGEHIDYCGTLYSQIIRLRFNNWNTRKGRFRNFNRPALEFSLRTTVISFVHFLDHEVISRIFR